jgi:hypothetical protein
MVDAMPIDPVTSAAPALSARPKAPAKSLNETDFGALVTEDLKAGLRPGPKMGVAGDGFKSVAKDQRFLPLNRATATGPSAPRPVETLGAGTKHPLGVQKR